MQTNRTSETSQGGVGQRVGNDVIELTRLFTGLPPSVRSGIIQAVKNVRILQISGHGSILIEVKGERVLVTTTLSQLFKED